MIFIAASTILFILFFQSMGNSLLLLLRLDSENPFLSIWLGFFAGAFSALFMAIWIPLDSLPARVTIFAAALPGARSTLRAWRKIFATTNRRALFACGSAFCLLLLLQGYAFSLWGIPIDTNLYHQQIVRWLKEYGLVPGLGNLHCRLAQVSGWLALAAIVDWGPFQARAAFIMPLLCLVSSMLYFLYGACSATSTPKRFYILCMFFLTCIYIFNFGNVSLYMIGLYYDRPALIFYIIFIAEFLPNFFEKYDEILLKKKLIIVSILICASILFKPVAVPAVVFYLILLIIYIVDKKINFHDLLAILWIPLCGMLLWVTINILLSGYPLFPFTSFRLPFDWTMREADVDWMRRAVQGWARWPRYDFEKALDAGVGYWFLPWLQRSLASPAFCLIIVAPLFLGTLLWFVAFWKKGTLEGKFFFCALGVSQLVYWFVQHPALRFGVEFFWSWMAVALVFAVSRERMGKFHWVRDATSILLFTVGICGCQCIYTAATTSLEGAMPQKLVKPGRHMPFEFVEPHLLHAGSPEEFTVYTAGAKYEHCGNSALPCARWLDEALFLRRPGDLGGGFTCRKRK